MNMLTVSKAKAQFSGIARKVVRSRKPVIVRVPNGFIQIPLPAFFVLAACLLISCRLRADTITPTRGRLPQVAGNWSEVVDGLRGRLLVEDAGNRNAKETVRVYIEIQSVEPQGGWRNVFFSCTSTIQWQLTDETGQPIQSVDEFAGVTLISHLFDPGKWIALSGNSTSRLSVCAGGYLSDGHQLVFRLDGYDRDWEIAPTKSATFYLGGCFSNETPAPWSGPAAPRPKTPIWKGTLVLPKVELPAS